MQSKRWFLSVLLTFVICPAAGVRAEELVVSDFDVQGLVNAREQTWEIWLKDMGNDDTQSCKMELVPDDSQGKADGQALRLEYDVDSPNPAYNGARVALGDFDASGYKSVSLYVKGDRAAGFTPNLKIELIGDTRRPSPQVLRDITGEWKKFTVPLSEFWAISDWTKLYQFVVVFDDVNSDPKAGVILIDHISFE